MESYEKIKKVLALGFMNFLDENKPKDKMCLSNGECADIEKAFNEKDWPKLARYLDKYTESEDERTRNELLNMIGDIPSDYGCQIYISGENKSRYIAYLERQKEPKLAPDDLQKSFEAGQTSIVDNPEKYGLCKVAEWSEEDERIKSCIGLALTDVDEQRFKGFRTTLKDCLNWLKSLRPQPKPDWSEEDKTKLRDVVRLVEDSGHVKSIREHYEKFLTSLPERFGLKPMPEWSEEDKQWLSEVYFAIDHSMYSEDERQAMKKYIDYLRYQSQSKLEWSKEDENKIERLAFLVSVAEEKEMISSSEGVDLRNFIKSLRPQPKPEWSERDERYFKACVRAMRTYEGNDTPTSKWIEALKDRVCHHPHWKPREEQMKELKDASAVMKCDSDDNAFPSLKTLYEQLEKL